MSCLRRCIIPPTYASSRYPFRGALSPCGLTLCSLSTAWTHSTPLHSRPYKDTERFHQQYPQACRANCFKLLTFHHFQITIMTR